MMSLDPSATAVARLCVDESAARRLADLLADAFASSAVAAFEAGEGAWAVEIHFDTPPDESAVRAIVASKAGEDAARALAFEAVASKDWVAASLSGLPPVPAGRFLVHGAHDRARLRPNSIGIEIEAALAFGTGHHGTTRGCLLAIDRLAKSFAGSARQCVRVLDVGTGTGVLAIAAAKALRGRVVASDIDARAAEVARANARSNHVAPWIEVVCAAGLSAGRLRASGPYRIVLANILLPPLKRMAAAMARLVAPGGHVVLSGLLDAHAATALAAYRAQGLALVGRGSIEGWTTLVLQRTSRARRQRGGAAILRGRQASFERGLGPAYVARCRRAGRPL
jgi:ribosomal protein L11 methyltransferase